MKCYIRHILWSGTHHSISNFRGVMVEVLPQLLSDNVTCRMCEKRFILLWIKKKRKVRKEIFRLCVCVNNKGGTFLWVHWLKLNQRAANMMFHFFDGHAEENWKNDYEKCSWPLEPFSSEKWIFFIKNLVSQFWGISFCNFVGLIRKLLKLFCPRCQKGLQKFLRLQKAELIFEITINKRLFSIRRFR